MGFKQDLFLLLKPYYFFNLFLSLSYIIAKKAPLVCSYIFPNAETVCEFDTREAEILLFLLIVVMVRTRKSGSVSMIQYITSSFIYCKFANLVLWAWYHPQAGLLYGILAILTGFFLPEPTYTGPEKVTYFRTGASLDAELERDTRVTWLVCFYTAWNPACATMAPAFAQLSSDYALENLKFGKIDIGRYPEAAVSYQVDVSTRSKQLPTLIMFQKGKEVTRRPAYSHTGQIIRFFFTEDNMKAAFDLTNIYEECKSNPLKLRVGKDKDL